MWNLKSLKFARKTSLSAAFKVGESSSFSENTHNQGDDLAR
jgi:hypothetical protein